MESKLLQSNWGFLRSVYIAGDVYTLTEEIYEVENPNTVTLKCLFSS